MAAGWPGAGWAVAGWAAADGAVASVAGGAVPGCGFAAVELLPVVDGATDGDAWRGGAVEGVDAIEPLAGPSLSIWPT